MSRRQEQDRTHSRTDDPLRLCVLTTVALLAWVVGPAVVVGFAGLGFAAYRRARRAGLTSSRCILRDTRLVLAYLGLVGVLGLLGLLRQAGALA